MLPQCLAAGSGSGSSTGGRFSQPRGWDTAQAAEGHALIPELGYFDSYVHTLEQLCTPPCAFGGQDVVCVVL